MDASCLSSPLQIPRPFSMRPSQNPRVGQLGLKRLHPRCSAIGHHDRGDWAYGRSVDEDLIVLRKRIHEMKMIESNQETPVEWMDWEKRYYAHYDYDICEAMGLLQNLLMNSRPSLGIGMVALVALSVPTSMFMFIFHLIEVAKGVL